MLTASIAIIRRARSLWAVLILGLTGALLLAAGGCAPKQSVPEGWPVKEAVPAWPAKIVSASRIPQGTWVMYFDSKQSFADVSAGLAKKLAKLDYKELPQAGVAPDSMAGFVSADGKCHVILTNSRKMPAPAGSKAPKSDYILSITQQPEMSFPAGEMPGEGAGASPHGGMGGPGGMPGGMGAGPHGGMAVPPGEKGASPHGGS